VFPLMTPGATLRIATTGAVIRPRTQPEGDLLPGADTRRFVVQEFIEVSGNKASITVAPLDAFALRMDLDAPAFEALGNDQNYKEVVKDQNGETEFRFRYSLEARVGGYDAAKAYTVARAAATPLLVARGRAPEFKKPLPQIVVSPGRAIATCLKPAELLGAAVSVAQGGQDARPSGSAGEVILRVQEVAGQSGPLHIGLAGFRRAVETDLLERDLQDLPLRSGGVSINLKPHGCAAIRLVP
jgi:hypothetical protein